MQRDLLFEKFKKKKMLKNCNFSFLCDWKFIKFKFQMEMLSQQKTQD